MKPKKGKKISGHPLGKASIEHLRKNHPHLYRALKNPTPRARLGANVTSLRMKKGMSRLELAAKAKVGSHTLKKIEEAHPSSNPTVKVIENLANAMGVDILDLYRFVNLAESIVR